jgi:hypothetical protein
MGEDTDGQGGKSCDNDHDKRDCDGSKGGGGGDCVGDVGIGDACSDMQRGERARLFSSLPSLSLRSSSSTQLFSSVLQEVI